jgi:hypothetical protein
MTQRERDIFIALIDAGLDESAVLSFVEGETGEAAGVIEALANDAHLAEMIWQLRADREAIGSDAAVTPVPASTLAMVSSVLDQEISDEIDASDLRTIVEANNTDLADIAPPTHEPIKVRRTRRHAMRLPSRTPRIIGSLAAAAVLVIIVSIALPNIDIARERAVRDLPTANNETQQLTHDSTAIQLADSQPTDTPEVEGFVDEPRQTYRPEELPIVVASAEEALRLAKEGRLIVRITSFRNSTTQTLATQLTTGSELMRFANIEGNASTEEAEKFRVALPRFEEPTMASADDPRLSNRPETTRESEGAYMLRVEPTERAFTMLIAKLKDYDGATVELVGATGPITTPGSAADLSGLTGSPTAWNPGITVPVVIESIQ